MSKGAIYVVNSGSQEIKTGECIDLGQIVRIKGTDISLKNGKILLSYPEDYELIANVSYIPKRSGTSTIKVYKDGMYVIGGFTSQTVFKNETYSAVIPVVVSPHLMKDSVIALMVCGVDLIVNHVSVLVKENGEI